MQMPADRADRRRLTSGRPFPLLRARMDTAFGVLTMMTTSYTAEAELVNEYLFRFFMSIEQLMVIPPTRRSGNRSNPSRITPKFYVLKKGVAT